MQLALILILPNMLCVNAFSVGGATSAFGAAKKFLTGTRKAKSHIHQTPLTETAPGAVSVSQSGDGIMKKSVDFLANGALLVGGLGNIYDHFASDPVSIFIFINFSIKTC